MDTKYLKQRVNELFEYINYLRDSANEDTKLANETIAEIKNKGEEESSDLIKKFKKIQFFNNLKLVEMEKTMPVLVELVSISKVIGIELELSDEQEYMVEVNRKRTTPMFVVDKNQLIFLNKELEEVIDKELDNPSETDIQAIKNILKAVNNE